MGALFLGQFVAQTGFANPGLSDDANHLPTPPVTLCKEVAQHGQLPLPADKATQGTLPVDFERGALRPQAHDGIGTEALHCARTRCLRSLLQLKPPLNQAPEHR